MKSFSFEEPVFSMWASFYTKCTIDEFMEEVDFSDDCDVSSSTASWLTITEKGRNPAIWIRDIHDLPTVVHEITHAVRFIGETIWIKLSGETDEFYAYYTDFLFRCYQEWVLGFNWKIGVKFSSNSQRFALSFSEEQIAKTNAIKTLIPDDNDTSPSKKPKRPRNSKADTKV